MGDKWHALFNALTPTNRQVLTVLIRSALEAHTMYTYKTIPFMGQTKGDKLTPENINTVGAQLQEAINANTGDGWEFYSIDAISFSQSPGCMGALFGGKPDILNYQYLIFRKQIEP